MAYVMLVTFLAIRPLIADLVQEYGVVNVGTDVKWS